MKKQIAALILIVSSAFATSAHADNLSALLTVLQNGSAPTEKMEMKDYNRCTDEELASGMCILKMSAAMTTMMDIKIAEGKKVQFSADPECGRDVIVRDPTNYELDLRSETEFKDSGTYTVNNRGFRNCEIQVVIAAPQL
ncbi:hypothetical protein [Bdellovibrio bacteriovorus]|uniref:Uncharacterized protein n=1 Tax=Bdellovibrio bacteriovorus str. Tiberius TaxID=1069642 RepID=K7ZBD3_BDEBC|nr:hypothetical protein [Bdellovibrio bacteriovorus]AFY02259.1 Hypothetical protein Bdt_2576 [Bdellovibrio bacteriovorus str. Tiberius]